MPDTQIAEGVDPISLVGKAYAATNYFAMKLQCDINNGRRGEFLKPTFEEFRYGFIGLYNLVGHRADFDTVLQNEIDRWMQITTRNKSLIFYRQSLFLYKKFRAHLVFLQEVS